MISFPLNESDGQEEVEGSEDHREIDTAVLLENDGCVDIVPVIRHAVEGYGGLVFTNRDVFTCA